jgi:hypothetical protein
MGATAIISPARHAIRNAINFFEKNLMIKIDAQARQRITAINVE